MFINNESMNNVKIEIFLKDLIDLQETAKTYFYVAEERDELRNEVIKLKEKIKMLENKGSDGEE